MRCEVAYAGPDGAFLETVELPDGANVAAAIAASGFAQRHPAVVVDDDHVGVWSERRSLTAVLREGDRVEIYRPLVADPKQARRMRAERAPLKRGR